MEKKQPNYQDSDEETSDVKSKFMLPKKNISESRVGKLFSFQSCIGPQYQAMEIPSLLTR